MLEMKAMVTYYIIRLAYRAMMAMMAMMMTMMTMMIELKAMLAGA